MSLRSGRHLKAARVLAGLTQQQLATEASLHVNSVKGWERHRDPIDGYAVDRMTETLKRRGAYRRRRSPTWWTTSTKQPTGPGRS
jgi:DNA-binding transcriptional regulator YiaG